MYSLLKKKNSNIQAGIVADETGTCVVRLKRSGKSDICVQSCTFESASDEDPEGSHAVLSDAALKQGVCSTLLNIGEYQLLVVDAPEVPSQELRAAVRWKIQDLIDFHIDEAVLDVFDAPPGGPAGTQKQMYVVVARSTAVKNCIEGLEQSGVNLKIIDIPELAMRNLAARLPEDESGLVTLYFSREQCLIILTHQSTLYLTRTVDFRFSDLKQTGRDPVEFSNRLALEIQRSLDYYEQHFQKAAIQSIALIPPASSLEGLDTTLQEVLGLSIRPIALDDVISCQQELDPDLPASCMLALGCALREESRAL